MSYYKDTNNKLHFLENDAYAYLLPVDAIQITEAEADAIRAAQNPLPTLAEIKAAKWEAIKAERERRTLSGGYQANGKWFHSDLISRNKQLGLNVLNGSVPPGNMWKTMDGSFIEMTWALAQQILTAASQSDRAIFLAAEAHRAAMEASADPANYDFSGGWPPVYGES